MTRPTKAINPLNETATAVSKEAAVRTIKYVLLGSPPSILASSSESLNRSSYFLNRKMIIKHTVKYGNIVITSSQPEVNNRPINQL